jgi:putative ABC transport system permease protein
MSPLFLYVVRSLLSRRLTTALTIGSLAMVSLTIASLLAAGAGLYRTFRTDATPPNVLHILHQGAVDVTDSSIPLEVVPKLTTDALIRRSSAEMTIRVGIRRPDGSIKYELLRALDEAGIELRSVQLVQGRFPTKGARELAVGDAFLKYHPDFALGRSHNLVSLDLTVVGIFHSPTPLDNQELWTTRAALSLVQQSANEIFLETASATDEQTLADSLTRQHVFPVTAEDTRAYHARLIHGFDGQYRWLLLVFLLVASGATMAVTSALTMIFVRRTGDMAVLRALGFGVPRIARLQLVETLFLSLLGGGLGCAIAAVLLPQISLAANPPFGTTFGLKLAAFELAATMGAMFVIGLASTVVPLLRLRRLEVRTALMEG